MRFCQNHKMSWVLNKLVISESFFRHFPVEAAAHVCELLHHYDIALVFRRNRSTKYGDFRPSANGRPHQISINSDLNMYSCLLVFLHEFAHVKVWELHGRSVPPHGKQWKTFFGMLIRDFVSRGFFHPTLHDSLLAYAKKVRASGVANEDIIRQLRMFDQVDDGYILLDEIPFSTYFFTRNGRLFRKGEKIRKRIKCFCCDNQRMYSFHPMARVRKQQE